jgi:hypothetical protein
MKILETKQGKIEIYPFIDAGKPQEEARGLETYALVVTEEQFDELLVGMYNWRAEKLGSVIRIKA